MYIAPRFSIGGFCGCPRTRRPAKRSYGRSIAPSVSDLENGAISMTKIYVGNLPFSATEDEVRKLFAQYGTVESLTLTTDRDTGRPRGFGAVDKSASAAARAIQNLKGKT